MVNGNGTSKPYLNFIGNSSTDVTGSMHLLRFKKYVTLLDCGMIQGADLVSTYQENKNQIKKIKPHEVDYIILSHCHHDHSGLIPAMIAKGCNAHIYIPKGGTALLKLLWEDSLKILISDCQKIQAKHGRKAAPYYSAEAIDKALSRIIEVDYFVDYKLNDNMSFTYYPAGHIIHSAQIVVSMTEGYTTKKVGYTGDIGGTTKRPYVELRYPLPFCDVVVGEATYSSKARVNSIKDRPCDLAKLLTISEESDKILIPCFSLQRTQEMLDILTELELDCPIYLDSPLAIKICKLWEDNNKWKNVHFIEEFGESQALQLRDEHCIILSASGFLQGGRIMNHLKTALPNPKNHVVFIGYSGENNLASQIKNGQKEVVVDGTHVANKANITDLRSFSSHASYEELIDYYSNECRYNKICLVHSNYDTKVDFCKTLQEELIKQGKSARVVCTNADQKIFI